MAFPVMFVSIDLAMNSGAGAGAMPLDYVLCIGDDSSDELMFEALHSKFGMHPADLDLFTVTVGRKPSKAQVYLGDHTEVVELLKMLASIGNGQSKRFASMGDLTNLNSEPAALTSSMRVQASSASVSGFSQSTGILPARKPRSYDQQPGQRLSRGERVP